MDAQRVIIVGCYHNHVRCRPRIGKSKSKSILPGIEQLPGRYALVQDEVSGQECCQALTRVLVGPRNCFAATLLWWSTMIVHTRPKYPYPYMVDVFDELLLSRSVYGTSVRNNHSSSQWTLSSLWNASIRNAHLPTKSVSVSCHPVESICDAVVTVRQLTRRLSLADGQISR